MHFMLWHFKVNRFPSTISDTIFSWCIADASKTGAAQEAVETIKRGSKTMTEAEARQILGVTENTPWEEIVKVFFFL